MEFGRVSKYLQEIDISQTEKAELEQKYQQLNDENEDLQMKIKNQIQSSNCESCRGLIAGKLLMVQHEQNEKRQ